jgi:iron complex outermembrane receptor protein
MPIIEDTFAIRASLNSYDDPGFIDYDYVINKGGVSVPDNKADTHSVKDANGQKTLTSRIALRWTATDDIDATLSYLYQNNKFEGRSVTNYKSLGLTNPLRDEIGKYSNASRYLEPDENTDLLISLEVSADLGFAELVSATGFSESENVFGQRDQSDLLLANPWSYETMPAFLHLLVKRVNQIALHKKYA